MLNFKMKIAFLSAVCAMALSMPIFGSVPETAGEESYGAYDYAEDNGFEVHTDNASELRADGYVNFTVSVKGEGYDENKPVSVYCNNSEIDPIDTEKQEYTVPERSTVKIIVHPEAGYYGEIQYNEGSGVNEYKSINHLERGISNDSGIPDFKITFRPISITAVTVNCGGTARTDRYDDSYSTAGTDTGTTLRLLDLLKDGHYPAYAAADSDSITDRLYSITVTKMRSGLKEYPEEGAESLTFNRDPDTNDFKNNEGKGDTWTDFVNGAYEEYGMADLTSVEVRLDYEKGYAYTFKYPDSSPTDTVTVYPGDPMSGYRNTGHPYNSGGRPFPEVPGKTGYDCKWYRNAGGGKSYLDDELSQGKSVAEEDREYSVEQIPLTYTVSFDANGGSLQDPVTWRVTFGKAYTSDPDGSAPRSFPKPARTGYVFKGWFTDPKKEDTKVSSGTTVIEPKDHSLFARWELKEYTISYKPNCPSGTVQAEIQGGWDAKGQYTIKTGTFRLKEPERKGYTFLGWTEDSGKVPRGSTGYVTAVNPGTGTGQVLESLSFTANWQIKKYTITYNLNGGAITGPKTLYTVEETFTLINPTKTGYTFAGWTGSNGTAAQTTVRVEKGTTENKTYTANFTPVTFTIVLHANGGTGSDRTINATYGTAVKLTNGFAKEGYAFSGWSKTASGGRSYNDGVDGSRLSAKQGDTVNLYAVWAKKQINVTAALSPSTGGTAVFSAGTKMGYGDSVLVTPSKGYDLKKISVKEVTGAVNLDTGKTETSETLVEETADIPFSGYRFTYSSDAEAKGYKDGHTYRIDAVFEEKKPYSAQEYGWSFTNARLAFWDNNTPYTFPKERYDEVFGAGNTYYQSAVLEGTDQWGGSCAGGRPYDCCLRCNRNVIGFFCGNNHMALRIWGVLKYS